MASGDDVDDEMASGDDDDEGWEGSRTLGLSYHVKLWKDYIFIEIEKSYKIQFHKFMSNPLLIHPYKIKSYSNYDS